MCVYRCGGQDVQPHGRSLLQHRHRHSRVPPSGPPGSPHGDGKPGAFGSAASFAVVCCYLLLLRASMLLL